MIWLSWRQFRGQALVALIGLTAVAIAFALTGPGMAHFYDTTVATCATRGDCDTVTNALLDKHRLLQTVSLLQILVPGLIGIFWGAPLIARELEVGTYRLAWTQSVTRTRWLAVKLGVVGLGSMLAGGLFSLLVTWWSSPLDTVRTNRFLPDIFSERGIVPIGYAAFAFSLGVTVGLVIRRTLPAMVTSLVAFTAVRVVTTLWIRPHLVSPAHQSTSLDIVRMAFGRTSDSGPMRLFPESPHIPNAWVLSTGIVDKAGHALAPDVVGSTCPGVGIPRPGPAADGGPVAVPDEVKDGLRNCVAKLSEQYHVLVSYQPASRYWLFQWYETGIFLGLSLLLAGFCFWWIRRRII